LSLSQARQWLANPHATRFAHARAGHCPTVADTVPPLDHAEPKPSGANRG
jgi:hypothetical protein